MKKGLKEGNAKATMAEVAAFAGVSQATVSLVLNNAGGVRVSRETRERVQNAAKFLGYNIWRRPNSGSGSIRSIGLLIDDLEKNPNAISAISGARNRAWANNCVLTVIPFQFNRELERAAIDLLLALRLVGVIYESYLTRCITLPKVLRTQPIVLLNCYTKDRNVPFIIPNHRDGAYHAVEQIIAAGHRRIGFINGSMATEAASDRLSGYLSALDAARIQSDPRLIRDGDWLMQAAEQETLALLQLADPPTAIFCASDRMAIGCLSALKSKGLRIPDDMSVVGFDDDRNARHITPPLSTVHVPHEQMGEAAVDYLLAAANRTDHALENYMPCKFISRGSVARLEPNDLTCMAFKPSIK